MKHTLTLLIVTSVPPVLWHCACQINDIPSSLVASFLSPWRCDGVVRINLVLNKVRERHRLVVQRTDRTNGANEVEGAAQIERRAQDSTQLQYSTASKSAGTRDQELDTATKRRHRHLQQQSVGTLTHQARHSFVSLSKL